MRQAGAGLGVVLALTVVVAGCVGPASPNEPTTGLDEAVGPAAASPAEPSTLSLSLQGFLVYRAASSSNARFEGDSPQFCFTMPTNTTRFAADFTWDTPNQMVLAFGAPGYMDDPDKVYADPPERPPTRLTPPLHVEVKDPEPGEWVASAVPWAVGAATNWELSLTWDSTSGSLTAEAVALDGGACFQG